MSRSILCFDSMRSGELSFISSAFIKAPFYLQPQIITTEETFRFLQMEGRSSTPLICQYNRPFSIGSLKLELLPSGSILGGASLHVETKEGRILYAPFLQASPNQIVRRMQLKKAEYLVLGAWHPSSKKAHINRNRSRERLLGILQDYLAQDIYPVIACEKQVIAPEIIKLCSDHHLPVNGHPAIQRITRIYDQAGSQLGPFSVFSRRNRSRKVTLLPHQHALRLLARKEFRLRPLIWIESENEGEGLLDQELGGRKADHVIQLPCLSDNHELKDVINLVKPEILYLHGPYAKRYAEEFRSLAPQVIPLYPNQQPALF